MKNLGKILAVVIAMSMLFGTVVFGATFTDVKDTDSSSEAITVLSSLGIITGYPDGTFGPDKSITRAEFSAVVDRAKALGDSADAAKGATRFTDVVADHWASGYINLAEQQGIVNGMGDGTFAPDKEVTFAQSVKMIVTALGYEPMAKSLGGWPSGYLAVAAQKSITKGVSSSKETQPATRVVVAKMLYNALEVPLMEQIGFGSDSKIEAGNKLLLDALDIIKVEGVVTANSYSNSSMDKDKVGFTATKQFLADGGKLVTATSSSSPAWDTDLSTSEKEILAGKTSAKDYLQYACVAYIKSIGDDPVFAAIAPKSSKNKTLTIKSSDIKFADNTLTTTTAKGATWDLTYYTDAAQTKEETVTIAADASSSDKTTYYYNGSSDNNSRLTDFDNTTTPYILTRDALNDSVTNNTQLQGTITLLNNKSDSDDYNVVFVNESKDYIVDEIFPKTFKVKDTLLQGRSIIFDMDNKDYDISFIKDGKPAKLEDIKKDDVLSVFGWIDKANNYELKYGKVVITSNSITGAITESSVDSTSTDNGDEQVVIGGKTYDYINNLNKLSLSDLKVSKEGKYFLNSDEKIIAVDNDGSVSGTTSYKLAYVTKIAKSSSISTNVQMRALLATGEWKTFDFASKVTVNDGNGLDVTSVDSDEVDWLAVASDDGVDARLDGTTTDTYLVYQMVGYDVNSEGKVTKIDFVTDSTDEDNNFYAKAIANANYDTGNKKFDGSSLYITDATILFNAPTSPITATTVGLTTTYSGASEDDISVLKSDTLVDSTEYGALAAYNYNSDDEISVLVGSKFKDVINYSDSFMVVDAVTSTKDSDGNDVTKYTGYQKDATVTVNEDSETVKQKVTSIDANGYAVVSDASYTIKKGSVIYFTKDSKGNADKLVLLFNGSSAVNGDTDVYAARQAAFGTNVVMFKLESGGNDNTFIFGYAFELKNSKYRIAVDANATTFEKEYQIASDVKVVEYDRFNSSTNSGKVKTADTGDIDTDSEALAPIDGDYVFARVNDNDKLADILIIKHN